MVFRPFPLVLESYIVINTNRNMSFAHFERSANLIAIMFSSHDMEIFESLPSRPFWRSFWGVNQLSTTSDSRDMDFRLFWEFWVQFWPKKLVSLSFQSDHQFSPSNRPSKDSETAAVSVLAIIGRSPSLLRLVNKW